MRFRFVILMVLAFILGFRPGAAEPFVLKEQMAGQDLRSHIQYVADPDRSLSPKELEQLPQEKWHSLSESSLGYIDHRIWVRLPLANPSKDKSSFLLEYRYSVFDRIALFRPKGQGEYAQVYEAGDALPFHQRPIDYHNVVFPVTLDRQSQENAYLRLESSSSMIISLYAYDQASFVRHVDRQKLILGFYYGAMLVMLFYNLFIFVSVRERIYLYYILYVGTYVLFQLTLNGLAFQYIWPEATWWAQQSIPFTIFLGSLMIAIFARSFLESRFHTPRMDRIYDVLIALDLLGVALFIFPIPYSSYLFWALAMAAGTMVFVITNGILSFLRGSRQARFFLIAWAFFALGVLMYVLKTISLLPDTFLTRWGIQIGSALEVVLISLGLADKINLLSKKLKFHVKQLEHTQNQLRESEFRYRNFFDSAREFTFTLDEEWDFISANKAIKKYTRFEPEELIGKNFLEFVFKGDNKQAHYNKIFILQKLEELQANQGNVQFQVEFTQKHLMEPKEMHVDLQMISLGEQKEIFGKAYSLELDALFKYLKSEKIVLSINNYLQNAELVSQRLTTHLLEKLEKSEAFAVRNALREIIINAIEHGNLGIDFDTKSHHMIHGDYLQFIQQRQNHPDYRDKKILIEYVLKENIVGYRITDEGEGFDHKKVLNLDLDDLNKNSVTHGRGIKMTLAVFDKVHYNERGNQVSLIKKFHNKTQKDTRP